jgi:hypothetical protein
MLLRRWGGEVISWTEDDRKECRPAEEIIDALSRVSRPVMIEASIPVSDVPRHRNLWPTSVGTMLKLDGTCTEWGHEAAIKPEQIVDLIDATSSRWPDGLWTT